LDSIRESDLSQQALHRNRIRQTVSSQIRTAGQFGYRSKQHPFAQSPPPEIIVNTTHIYLNIIWLTGVMSKNNKSGEITANS